MTDWQTTTLGRLGTLRNGVNFSREDEGPGLPVLKVKDFGSSYFVPAHGLDELDLKRVVVPQDQLLEPGDCVIIRSNGNSELVGRTLFCTGADRPTTFSGFCIRFRPAPDRILPRYAAYFLRSPLSRQRFTAYGSGTGIQNLNQDIISNLPLELPSLDEQIRIADILGSLDDKIELNRRTNETLEAMARTLFRSWCVDFDPVRAKADGQTPPGLDAATAKLFPDSFEPSALGPIPKGWQVSTLGTVATNPRRGVSPNDVQPETPYFGLEHMPRRSICLGEWGCPEELASGKFQFDRGNILFGKLRPYFHKVGVAPVAGICSTDILVITPKQPEWFGFVLGHVSSDELVAHTDAASTGTKMPRTNWSDISRYSVAVPPVELAQRFTSQITPLVQLIRENILQSLTLVATRDALLPKLLSGEVQVGGAERIAGGAA